MEEQTTNENWLKEEAEKFKNDNTEKEKLPALRLEENKLTLVEVDFSKPFETWTSEEGVIKKIVPVTVKGQKFVWWLNVRNPIYSQIVRKGILGKNKFNILQTGSQKNTKYALIDTDNQTLDYPKQVSSEIL